MEKEKSDSEVKESETHADSEEKEADENVPASQTAKSDLDSVNGVDRSVVESAESGEEPSSFLAEDAIDESINSIGSTCKEPGDEEQESSVDVNAQQEQANNKIKVSAGSCKAAKSDSGGTKYGDTSKSTSTKDKTLSTEDKKVPVPTSQSSQVSQPVNAGVRGNGASTRSTRSQNPEFLARHRNFLHKIHLASNNATDEELFTDDDESTASKATTRSGGSVQTEENSNSVVDGMAVRRKRERSASNGTLSPRIPSPSVVNMISGSASANNSDGSSPATSQMQPAIKKRRSTRSESSGPLQSPVPTPEATRDRFCWGCHKDGVVINCETCPRVYHLRCIQLDAAPTEDWVCPECITILHAENTDTRSRAMKLLSLDHLCNLLKYAVSRMKTQSGAEPFWKAVDVNEFSQYREYVAHPMDLSLLERNIKKRMYGSTEAFLADTKWILHNCIIFNTYQSRLTGVAKLLVKICKHEMSEIENCPDCYLNAHTRKDSWFIEVCRRPHLLVWAKLKGFPFWPAKVMRTNKEGMVDVRFFGAHDRAWVPVRECFLYSKAIPTSARNKKRNNLEACIQEVEQHAKKLRDKFGIFEHAPFRTHFNPAREREQLRMLLPGYNGEDDTGPPNSKRNKLHAGGYSVRTYHRSNNIGEGRERNKSQTSEADELNMALENEKFTDKNRNEKRKTWERDGYPETSEDEKKGNQSRKRTASGSRVSRQSSSSEDSQESDGVNVQDRGNSASVEASAKSASLIEWSRFEESAAKLSVSVEVSGSDEDKHSVASDDRKLKDGDDSRENVLPSDDAKLTDDEDMDKDESNEIERKARVAASEVVKKVLSGPSIADKLQEKLLRLGMSNEESSVEETSSENNRREQNVSNEKEEASEGSKNSEDCETENLTGCAKEQGKTEDLHLETSCERTKNLLNGGSDLSDIENDRELERDRSQSPVVNKTPLKSERKCYGKQYSPKVVLHNIVLSSDEKSRNKATGARKESDSEQTFSSNKDDRPLSPAQLKEEQETLSNDQHINESASNLDNSNTSPLDSSLKNRSSDAVNHKTDLLHDSSTESGISNESNSINSKSGSKVTENDEQVEMVENSGLKNVLNDNTSESGDGDIEMDSSKRTPEHGYSRISTENSVAHTSETCEVDVLVSSEQKKASLKEEENRENVDSCVVSEPLQESTKESENAQRSEKESDSELAMESEAHNKEVTANESPPDTGTVNETEIKSDDSESNLEPQTPNPVENNSDETTGVAETPSDETTGIAETPSDETTGIAETPSDETTGVAETPSSDKEEVVKSNISETDKVEEQQTQQQNSQSEEIPLADDHKDEGESVGGSGDNKSESDVVNKENDNKDESVVVNKENDNKDESDVVNKENEQSATCTDTSKEVGENMTNDLNITQARLGNDVTITPANVISSSTEKEDREKAEASSSAKELEINSIADKKIKEEPIDPDELVTESSSVSSSAVSSTQSSTKSSPEPKKSISSENRDVGADKVIGSDDKKFGKVKSLTSKKLNLSLLDDKERLASNDSPASVSEKDGIFPSLFLDPSITITVINEKQSDHVDIQTSSKSKVSGSDINVNELRASVNLSKDISLTVVGANYSGTSKDAGPGPVTPLDMECDHESDHDDSNNSTNTTSSTLIPLAVQNALSGQNNTSKQKKQRPSNSNESLQARSRARKSFPNRPILPNVKMKTHPELVNGVGTYGSKSSLLRRNSVGTNSNSSDSRRSSYGTSPHDMIISAQQSGDNVGENAGSSDNNNNNPGSAMVVLPPMLGNPPTSTTNHIQALRTVNGNIGAPSHLVNGGPDIISTRMMQVPHGQPHPGGNSARISPAGQGPGTSRMPPQLQPRPQGPLLAQHPPSVVSEAGPVSAELNRHASKLSDFLRSTIEEILRDLSNMGNPEATIKSLQLELEKLQWRHNQEMAEMKHNTDLMMMEMRASMESERQRAVAETIRQCEMDKQRAVEETKKKQWCTNCGKEALFYCCWNTSYCDYPCQQHHWPQHMSSCAQNSSQGAEGSSRDGGDIVQRSSPQTSSGTNSQHKASSSQQQQVCQTLLRFKVLCKQPIVLKKTICKSF
ncbi:MYND-type zinc finger-containing chromatin reader ZMYND8 isoform X2 [Periplaneta americana]|uniref:MYND-type zinc finger-containing chromatin reader ZMYND8 isoform X2 n=1 Tax=Periplaneta americana TaxID=6978 RepID=UPI0037E9BC8E